MIDDPEWSSAFKGGHIRGLFHWVPSGSNHIFAEKKNAQRRLFLYILLQAFPAADGFVKRTLFALGISCRTEVAAKEDEQMVAFVLAAAVDLAAQLLFHL